MVASEDKAFRDLRAGEPLSVDKKPEICGSNGRSELCASKNSLFVFTAARSSTNYPIKN